MKKCLAVLLIPALVFCGLNLGALRAGATGGDGNLLNNPGFEEAFSDAGWSPDGCVITTDVIHTGSSSARLGAGETGFEAVLFHESDLFVDRKGSVAVEIDSEFC